MSNNASQVAVGQPKVGGAVFYAPKGTTVPTDGTTALGSEFVNLGYVSDAGVVFNEERSTTDMAAWGGDVVRSTQDTYKETAVFTLLQLNQDVKKFEYGADYVTGTATEYTVKSTSQLPPECVLVVECVMNDEDATRYVMPSAKLTTRGSATHDGKGSAARQLTMLLSPDADGVCHYEYTRPLEE